MTFWTADIIAFAGHEGEIYFQAIKALFKQRLKLSFQTNLRFY